MTTNTINADLANLTTPPEIEPVEAEKGAVDAVFHYAPINPQFKTFEGLRGFRLNRSREDTVRLLVDGVPTTVTYPVGREDLVSWEGARTFKSIGDATIWFSDGLAFRTEPWRARVDSASVASSGTIIAPMPGKVTAVEVATGEKVSKGQRLLTLEAMKMEHGLTAPFDGTVAEVNATAGAQVSEGAVHVRVEPASSPA
jgi:3-methylcrotonyl-CoA carboxylase alpha subunit